MCVYPLAHTHFTDWTQPPPPGHPTHHDVLQLDVSVQEPSAVEESDPFHNVTRDLHACHPVQANLQGSVEVARVAGHDEKDLQRAAGREGLVGEQHHNIH